METIKFAYLAGYIDGDGCFFVRTYLQKPKNILVFDYSIQVASVDKNIITYFKKEFGGTSSKKPITTCNRKDSYVWVIKTKKSINIAENIFHFLISKKITCDNYIILGKSIIPNFGINIPKEIINQRLGIINKIKEEIHMNDKVTIENFKLLKKITKNKEPNQSDLAYFAGLIDAEGCFRISHWKPKRINRNHSYVSVLEIGNTKHSIFPWILERFGGNIVYRKPTSKNNNPMIIWCLRSKALEQILSKIHPFLKLKKERCEKLMELQQTNFPNGGIRKGEAFKIKVQQIQERRKIIVEDLHKLNAKGKH